MISPFTGASLRSLQVVSGGNQFELISGGDGEYDPRHVESGTGSFIMAPWPNRITDGKLYMNGEVVHTLPTDGDRHAQHGTVRRREWSILGSSGNSAHLAIELLPPWPFPGHLEYEVKLEGPSLVQSFLATDSGGSIYPFGIGWHPWFRRDLGSGPVVAHIPWQEIVWELDDEMVSTGRQLAPEGPTDLRLPMTPELGVTLSFPRSRESRYGCCARCAYLISQDFLDSHLRGNDVFIRVCAFTGRAASHHRKRCRVTRLFLPSPQACRH